MQANEVIRWLLGEPVQTIGQRLLIDSTNYELYREGFVRDPDCSTASCVSWYRAACA